MTSEKKKKELTNLLFYLSLIVLPMIQFVVFYIIVNANSFVLAFKKYEYDENAIVTESIVILDNFVQVIKDLFTKEGLQYCFGNSMLFYGVTFLSSTVLSLFFSFYIYKKRFLAGTFKAFLYMPSIVSVMVISILYKYFCSDCIPTVVKDLFDKRIGNFSDNKYILVVLFNFFISCGGNMLVYTGTMASISDSVIEASEVDGVNSIQQLWYIVLPGIYQTVSLFIVTGLLVIFSGQANLFNFFGLDADSELYTFGYYMYSKVSKASETNNYLDYPYLSAFGLVLTAVAIPIIFITRNLLEKFGPKDV